MKIKLRQFGFSLIEVMVAIGIIGGLSLVIVQLMDNSNKQINYIDFKLSGIDFKKELTYQLSFSENCVQSLDNGIVNPANLKNKSVPLDKITKANGRTLFKVGNTYNRDLVLSALTLKNFIPESAKITHQGVADLEYRLKAKKKVLGPEEVSRNLRLEMFFDRQNHKIARCRVMTDGSTNVSNKFRSQCINGGGSYYQGDRCRFQYPKAKVGLVFKSIFGNAIAYNDGFQQVEQTASKNSSVFCQYIFGPNSYATSYFGDSGGKNNVRYIGTDRGKLEFRELTARASTTGAQLLRTVVCTQ